MLSSMRHVDFAALIKEEAVKLEALHGAIHRTLMYRERDAKSRREWEQACDAFHSYVSTLDPFLERACEDERYADKDLLEFAVCFLEVDPWFFRSGYLKQILLTRLKRSELGLQNKRRLRAVLLDAVDRRGTREFKYYCRLAAAIADRGLVAALEKTGAGTDDARSNRARLMLATIRQKEEWRVAGA
jgi:hypothetical protein